MNPFTQVENPSPKTLEEFVQTTLSQLPMELRLTLTAERQAEMFHYLQRCEHYVNDLYHVALDRYAEHGFGRGSEVWHLSIKRHTREPINDWREMQEIKSAICGAEMEAIQLYPKESRVVDTANQYHLFAFAKMSGNDLPMFPVGFTVGLRTDDVGTTNAKQRPRT